MQSVEFVEYLGNLTVDCAYDGAMRAESAMQYWQYIE